MSIRTIMVVQSYHRGGTFVPSWWYNRTIVVVRLLYRIGGRPNSDMWPCE